MTRLNQFLITFLANAAWQCSLLALVAAVCCRLLKNKPARVRHLLLVFALFGCIILPASTSLYFDVEPKMLASNASGQSLIQQDASEEPVVAREFSQAQISLPFVSSPTKPLSVTKNFALALLVAYFLFVLFRIARLGTAWSRIRAIRNDTYALDTDSRLASIVIHCRTALGLTDVPVFRSPQVKVPLTLGAMQPIVVLPEQLVESGDSSLLTAAIAHEAVHILRRDYLLNLIYELIHVPLSFHPAVAMLRRRIIQTRELCCDEVVTEKLLDGAAYARSLIRLAGSAFSSPVTTGSVTVGIADADILEERIMSILHRSKSDSRRKAGITIATVLLLGTTVAAAPFALRVKIDQTPTEPGQSTTPTVWEYISPEHQSKPIKRKVVMPAVASNVQSATLVAWLKTPGDFVEAGEIIARVDTGHEEIGVPASTRGTIERLMVREGERFSIGKTLAVIREQPREMVEAVTRSKIESEEAELKRELAMRDSIESKERGEAEKRLAELLVTRQRQEQAVTELGESAKAELDKERAREGWAVLENKIQVESLEREGRERRKVEMEYMTREQAELARQASIPMHKAMETVLAQFPGTVLESRLIRERNQPCYVFIILSDSASGPYKTHVLVSAIDGALVQAVKENL